MRIAIIDQNEKYTTEYGDYITEIIGLHALQQNYEIRAWSNVVPGMSQKFADNSIIIITNNATSAIGIKWFNTVKLKRILKYSRPDILIFLNSAPAFKTTIPSFFVFDEERFLQFDANKKLYRSVAKNFHRYALPGNQIFSFSNGMLLHIKKYVNDSFIFSNIPFSAGSEFKVIEWIDKIILKSKYAGNKEYFTALIDGENEEVFTALLKTFSRFKKWQQSSMQLLILPSGGKLSPGLDQKLSAYKYREDVSIINEQDAGEKAAIIGAAYGLIHIPAFDKDILPAVIGATCATPVITYRNKHIKEYCGDAALYASKNNYESLSDEVITLFKDEALKTKKTEACQAISPHFSRVNTSEKIWALLQQTLARK